MTRAFSLIILTVVNCPDSTADNIAKRPVRVLLRRCKYMQKRLTKQELAYLLTGINICQLVHIFFFYVCLLLNTMRTKR
jgi:hypothetical protein